MRIGIIIATVLVTGAAAAAPARLVIHNQLLLPRTAAVVEIPANLLPHDMKGQWVAVVHGKASSLQRRQHDAITVLDLPAQDEIPLHLRPYQPGDPSTFDVARATIPIKAGKGYRDVKRFVVPKTHVIHDPLFPIEGAGWESGRVAYRVYLDKRNALDIFGKKLPAPVLDKIGQGGPSYHDEGRWGMDIWHVGDSLGAGGLGVLRGKMATQLGDMKRMVATVAANGPMFADLHVEDDGWVFEGKPARLSTDYTITAGSRVMMISASATPGVPLVAGFGKYPNTDFMRLRNGSPTGWGYLATWGRQSENHKDIVGVALFYPIAEIARTGDDGRSIFVVFKNPAKVRYAFAAAWAREGHGIKEKADFRYFLDNTALELGNPVTVTERK